MPYRKHVSTLLVNDLNLHAYLQEIALFDRRSERLLHERGVLGKAVWFKLSSPEESRYRRTES
jgi:hypothetical protein